MSHQVASLSAETVPVARHMVRLAVADHLDIPFQEAQTVQLRQVHPSLNHASLKVEVWTNRVNQANGQSMLDSFLANASMASELLGLTVHDIIGVDEDDSQDGAGAVVAEGASEVAGENSDLYIEHYTPLEEAAEKKASGKSASIAGVDVPEGVPVALIAGVAAGVMILVAATGIWLHYRRRQLAHSTGNEWCMKVAGKEVDLEVAKPEKKVANDVDINSESVQGV